MVGDLNMFETLSVSGPIFWNDLGRVCLNLAQNRPFDFKATVDSICCQCVIFNVLQDNHNGHSIFVSVWWRFFLLCDRNSGVRAEQQGEVRLGGSRFFGFTKCCSCLWYIPVLKGSKYQPLADVKTDWKNLGSGWVFMFLFFSLCFLQCCGMPEIISLDKPDIIIL